MSDKHLRIVHCANFSEKKFGAVYYSTDRKISNGLIRNGHSVHDFSYRDIARYEARLGMKRLGIGKMNSRLIQTIDNVEPDLLLLGHSELVENDTLRNIRIRFPNLKIAMWWVDPLDGFLVNRDFFIERIDLVDDFFITTDPEALKAFLPLEKPLSNIHFMPNICDKSVDIGCAYDEATPRHDLLFIGRKTGLRGKLIDFLQSKMTGLDLGLYGQRKETIVLGHKYIDLLSQCRMAINFSRYNDIPLYSSDRQVHLAANGCLTFTPETPKMRDVFSESEMVYFSDFDDLESKIFYYQTHMDEARDIAKAGQKRALQDYEAAHVSDRFTKILLQTGN